MANHNSIVDLGCGPRKVEGAYGVDMYPYEGVDKVVNLDQPNWDLPADSFDTIYARHIIEHVKDVPAFLREIHRIGKPGARVYIETPHYSSVNSWTDPTHVRHLAAYWFDPFLAGQYLSVQTGAYEAISTTVTFGKSIKGRLGSLMVAIRGLRKWEKNSAFSYPGMDVQTWLKIRK